MGQQQKNYGLVESLDELERYCERLLDSDAPIGFDIETGFHGPDVEKASVKVELNLVAGISFTDSTDWARYAPLGHDAGTNLDNKSAARLLWPVLNSGRGVAHNAKFELRNLARWFRENLADDPQFGAEVRAANGYFPVRSDTQVEAYLIANDPAYVTNQSFGLKPLTKVLFGHEMTELHELFPDLAKNKRKYLRFNVLDQHDPKVRDYACEDAVWCLAIHEKFWPQVKDRFLYAVEHGVIEAACEMEDFGVRYDWGFLRRAAEELREFQSKFNGEIMAELTELTGEPVAINLASPAKVRDVLYTKLGMSTSVHTASTKDKPPAERVMSTGKIALAGLAKQHPIVRKILDWKEQSKLLGTYLDKYELLYGNAPDGHTHPNHLTAFVITGRFAVSDPPYQQCVPGSYQVLTQHGWERLDKLADGVPVAQFTDWGGDREGRIDFVTPEVVRSPYHGDMIEFRSAEGGTWRYTPNHRIVYRQRRKRKPTRPALSSMRETTAEQWEAALLRQRPGAQGLRLHDRYMQKAGWHWAGDLLTDDERASLRLAVAVQADGSRTPGHQYDIAVHKERKVTALRELGLQPEQQSRDRWRVRVPVSAVERWLDDNKDFRAEAILKLSFDELRYFVREVMQWDGDATRGCTYGQHVTRRTSVDVVQAAACLAGHGTSIYERPEYDAVTVNVHRMPHKGFGWQEVSRVPADGMVYCVTVPTGMFLCRNDEGKVLVTGNSPKTYHFDLNAARDCHARHADDHGDKCRCDDPAYTPPPGTCWKFNFRDAVIAPPEHYIVGFDLSQAELRAIAGEARETALLEAFGSGADVHTLTAALMLGIDVADVTKKQRDIGKTLNFALMYGMGAKSLADRLGIPKHEAEALFDKYFSAYAKIAAWSANQVHQGKLYKRVTSKFGRVLPIWEFDSDKKYIQEKGERACVNYPIQGAATGDYMKTAMVRARKAIRQHGLNDRVHMVMNVHDALEFYVHRSVTPDTIIPILQQAVIFPVEGWPPMRADWHIAKKWGSPVEVELTADGRLLVGDGEHKEELRATALEEDDEGNEVEVMPEVDLDLLRSAAAPAAGASPRTLIIELPDMPDAQAWARFVALVKARPGEHRILLRTPEGELALDALGGTDLDPAADTAEISILLGATKIIWDVSSVEPELLAGFSF